MGWFEHGSTIIVFAPDGFSFCGECQRRSAIIQASAQPLMRLP